MTEQRWSTTPYTVHVNGDPTALAQSAAAAGALVLRWSIADIRNQRQLDASASRVFDFPFPSASAAGLIDMLSDLEWLEIGNGVLMIIDAAGARQTIVEVVAGLLPGIADRWRSGTAPFEVFFVGVSETEPVAAMLERRNVGLDEFGRLPWTRDDVYRVPVVIHSPAAEA
jgi:hypothetical protein